MADHNCRVNCWVTEKTSEDSPCQGGREFGCHHPLHFHQGFKRARREVFCLCCCCCNPSVRKNALLTRLSVPMSHSPCSCVVSTRLRSKERSSLCACFCVTQVVMFHCLLLPRYRGNHVEFRVAQERACCASSRTPGGSTRSRNRGAERAPHFASRILSPWSNDAEKSKATERVEVRSVSALDLEWVKMLALWKQRSCGAERTHPRRLSKSGARQQGRPYCDASTSRKSVKEHEC